jgi:hypothetical protein
LLPKANLVSDDATLVHDETTLDQRRRLIEATTHALAPRPRNCVFAAGGCKQTLVPKEGSLVPDDATLVPSATTLVRDKTTLVHDATTLVRDETTLVPDDATLVRHEATLVPFGNQIYKPSTSYQRYASLY